MEGLVILMKIIILLIGIVFCLGYKRLGSSPEGFNILFIAIMIPLWLVYFVLQEGLWGQTIGKRITKIKAVKTNGERAEWLKVLIRNMATKNRQRIGDIIAGTIVVKVDEL